MVVVELMDGAGQLTPVPVGETTLGRGDMLGNSDKRLSRKQVVLEVEEGGDVFITVQGVNPTYMTKKGTEKPKMLKKGKKYPVKNGDHFCLLTTNYPYTVKIKNPPTPSNPSLTSLSSSQSQHESSQKPSKKPQQQQHHDSEEEEGLDDKKNRNDNNNNNSKKRKIEEDSDDGWGEGSGDETTQKYHNAKLTGKFGKHAGRGGGGGGEGSANPHNKPQCKYGAECYRRNPAHWDEFYHPGDKKIKQDNSGSKKTSQNSQSEDELVVVGGPGDSPQKSPPQKMKQDNKSQPVQQSTKKTVNFEDFKKGTKPPQLTTKTTPSFPSGSKSNKDDNGHKNENRNENRDKEPSGEWSFAFPLISTSPYKYLLQLNIHCQFDTQKAVVVASEAIKDFQERHTDFSLSLQVVVESDKLNTISKLFRQNGLSEKKITITTTPILETGAKVIAVENTWRLKQEPRNSAVYSASECLDQETKKRYPEPAKQGGAYPVPLPPQTPLTHQGVNWVMHCVGPNMNPKKSDCIESYEESTPILKKTFESMLSSMYDIALGKHDY